ncbi:MAG: type IV toxin-antitoxin system AbiEi family antitoxin domain-containing protein, partial [Burkholderiales bacterium]|nr:type IV toxin-antitoxin system AbiEi family antitoxin domain-containing protein [Burkholderiales bacterium]
QMGLVRPVDLETRDISRAQLYRLVRKGLVARQARGIHVASQHPYTTEHTLAAGRQAGPGRPQPLIPASSRSRRETAFASLGFVLGVMASWYPGSAL